MPLVDTKEMFKKAYEGHYAVGAFNVNNMEIIQGIVEGAIQEKAPLPSWLKPQWKIRVCQSVSTLITVRILRSARTAWTAALPLS